MRVLLLRGNPRRSGMTEYLVNLFARGVREVGNPVSRSHPLAS